MTIGEKIRKSGNYIELTQKALDNYLVQKRQNRPSPLPIRCHNTIKTAAFILTPMSAP